jgi:Ferric reductase NAD binding domain/FAD-binding domain
MATVFAILPLRINFYEIFVITHIVLIILALIGCWYHLVPHFGYIYGYQVWLYICFAFWAADRVARVARVLYYNEIGGSIHPTGIVEMVPGCDIMQVTVFPRVGWAFGPGQHTFLYLPGLGGKFWESHPFSVAGWRSQGQSTISVSTPTPVSHSTANGEKKQPDVSISAKCSDLHLDSNQHQEPLPRQDQVEHRASIHFLIRKHSGITSSLHRCLLSASSRLVEISVYTEGPYAGHRATLQPLLDADTVLCIAGGIGITNALGFIQEYASANIQRGECPGKSRGIMRTAKRFILAWSAKEMALIEHVKQTFLVDQAGVNGIEYSFYCTSAKSVSKTEGFSTTSSEVMAGRMDIGTVIRSALEVGHQTTVLMCGPGNMADEATRQVVNCVKEGHRVDLVEEAFAW